MIMGLLQKPENMDLENRLDWDQMVSKLFMLNSFFAEKNNAGGS